MKARSRSAAGPAREEPARGGVTGESVDWALDSRAAMRAALPLAMRMLSPVQRMIVIVTAMP